MALGVRGRHLEIESDPDVIAEGWFVMDHDDYVQSKRVAAEDMPGSGGGDGPLPDGVVLDDGTTPFTAPQAGVAATAGNHLATKAQLDAIAGSAASAAAAAAAADAAKNDAINAAFAAARVVHRTLTDANLTAGVYTVLSTDLTKVILCNFTTTATVSIPNGLNTTLGPSGEPTVAVIDILNTTANNVTIAAAGGGSITGYNGNLILTDHQAASIYVHSGNAHLLRR